MKFSTFLGGFLPSSTNFILKPFLSLCDVQIRNENAKEKSTRKQLIGGAKRKLKQKLREFWEGGGGASGGA